MARPWLEALRAFDGAEADFFVFLSERRAEPQRIQDEGTWEQVLAARGAKKVLDSLESFVKMEAKEEAAYGQHLRSLGRVSKAN